MSLIEPPNDPRYSLFRFFLLTSHFISFLVPLLIHFLSLFHNNSFFLHVSTYISHFVYSENFDFLISGGHPGWQIANPFLSPPASCTVCHLLDIPACTFLSAVLSVSTLGITNYLWSPRRVNPSFGHTRTGYFTEQRVYGALVAGGI